MKVLHIVPKDEVRLFGAFVEQETALRRAGRGTFYRSGPRKRGAAKWKHKRHGGWLNLERGLSEVVTVEVHTPDTDEEWQIFAAFLGFVDRHFRDDLLAINVLFR